MCQRDSARYIWSTFIIPKNVLRHRERRNGGIDDNDNEDITKDNEWFPEHTLAFKISLCSHS